jgi:multiple sugar transport system permease protein
MPGNPNEFIGLANYSRALQDPIVALSMRNTVLYTFITVPGQMILAFFFAFLVNKVARGKIFFRTLYYIPVITSWVVVSILFRYLFQSPKGLINHILLDILHVIQQPVAWFRQPATAFIPILLLGIWKGIGWSMVIFLAALQTIPREFYDAAAIDGATAWRQLTSITLPLIRPTLVFTLVMLMIGGFNVFISVVLITDGGPVQSTEVILSYMYHQAFDYIDFGYGAALSFIVAIIIVTASYLQIRFLRRPEEIG